MVLNEKLLEVMGDDVTQEQACANADHVLKNAVGGISDIVHTPGLINNDLEDVKTVVSEPGKAMVGTAVACPLLESIDLGGAVGDAAGAAARAVRRHAPPADPDADRRRRSMRFPRKRWTRS